MKKLSIFIDESGDFIKGMSFTIMDKLNLEQFRTQYFSFISNVEFRKAEPQKYRLLQVAAFICSMELLKIKKNENYTGVAGWKA